MAISNLSPQRVTQLLEQITRGDELASDELLPLVYNELRNLARSRMAKEQPGQTLQATGLVHEAYIRLIGEHDVSWDSRGHFFAAASEARRRILIERARKKARLKHGGQQHRVTLDDLLVGNEPQGAELLALDEALSRLEVHDETMAQVVKMRFFVGFTIEETASALAVSPRSVNRLWTAARVWLLDDLLEAN